MKTITFTIVDTHCFTVKNDSCVTIRDFIEKNKHLYHDSDTKKTYFRVEFMDSLIENFDKKIIDYAEYDYDCYDIFSPDDPDLLNDDCVNSDDDSVNNEDKKIINMNDNNKNDDNEENDDIMDDNIMVDDNDEIDEGYECYQEDFNDFNGDINYWRYLWPLGNDEICFDVIIEETIVKDISDTEYNQPIINILQDNDIYRACWTTRSNGSKIRNIINIRHPFSHYDSTKYIGYSNHREKCKGTNCDLITYGMSDNDRVYSIKQRFGQCKFKIVSSGRINNKQYKLRIPLLCNRKIILNTFIENSTNYFKNYENIKLDELDLYYVSDFFGSWVARDSPDFLYEGYHENENILDNMPFGNNYMYVILLAEMRKNQMREMMVEYLPKELADIIFMYMNSKKKLPEKRLLYQEFE